ncbi:MAG TPA: TatD family hydrolase [Stellaceae bacterium]|jgi:TatD DNase family protein
MLIDSHCHLDFEDFGAERDEVLARARRAGVDGMLTICTKITEFPAVRALAEANADVWCSVGIHPHEAASQPETDAARLAGLASHPKVVGIGETGLDFFYDHSPRDRQEAVFRAHCAAARETGLPLIVHTRDADDEMAAILRDESRGGILRGVIHCFSSGRQLAQSALEIGFYISLSGIVTFKKAEALRTVARDVVPLDRLLVETDAPYLAPVPYRGKRNEPSYVVHTAALVAELKGVSPEALADATTANFFRLFDKAGRSRPAGSTEPGRA